MQKNIWLLALLICTTTGIFAQKSLNRFIHKHAHHSGAEFVNIGRLPMMLVRPFIDDDDEDTRFLKSIRKVQVLSINLKDAATNMHEDLSRLQRDLVSDGYDELMFVRSEGDRVHILGKIENDVVVKDCILLVDDADEVTVVHVNGKINLDEIGNLSGKFGNAKFTVARK